MSTYYMITSSYVGVNSASAFAVAKTQLGKPVLKLDMEVGCTMYLKEA